MSPRTSARGFYADRVPVVASEPNFAGAGASLLPGTKALRVAGTLSTLCLAVLLGVAFSGDAPALAIALVGSGAALVLAACLFADSQ